MSNARKITVGMVDDHESVILGVQAVLSAENDISMVAAAANVPALLAPGIPLQVVLLDLSLNDGSSIAENVTMLTEAGCGVLAFTSGEQPHLIREASRAGILGVLRKSEGVHQIASALRLAAQGKAAFDAEWAAVLEEDRDFIAHLLTPREVEVLALYASGETAASVAQTLFLSRDTVLDHVKRIREKYAKQGRSVSSKIGLFQRAVEDGIVKISH